MRALDGELLHGADVGRVDLPRPALLVHQPHEAVDVDADADRRGALGELVLGDQGAGLAVDLDQAAGAVGGDLQFLETTDPNAPVEDAKVVCETVTTKLLLPGECEIVVCSADLVGGGNIYVDVDPEDKIADCHPGMGNSDENS